MKNKFKKIGFVFPGQGAQYLGMGKEIFENYKEAREIFEEATIALGFNVEDLCFNSSEEILSKTENTQVAMLTVSSAILKVIESYNIIPYCAAGLSLGEYGALVASKALKFKEAVVLIKKRGKIMQEAVPPGIGSMVALLGIDEEKLELVLAEGKKQGIVEASNFNCKGQIVIGGEIKSLEIASNKAKELGGKAIYLNVSAPFHTSMLKDAADKFYEELKEVDIKKPEIKLCLNLTGKYLENQDLKEVLRDGIKSSVFFKDEIETMIEDGVEIFIEIGPSKTLSSFIKKTNRNVLVLNVEDLASLKNTLSKLEEENNA